YRFFDPVATIARFEGHSSTGDLEYPLNALVWAYPDLGMRIMLQDRALDDTYDYPFAREAIPGMTPDPARLAARPDLVPTGDGRGVFPSLPPRVQRLDTRGMIARFQGAHGPRLL